MVIPFPFAIWQLDTCPRLEVCISTDAEDHTEAPAGGRKGHGMAVAKVNDYKNYHSTNTLQKKKVPSAHPHPSILHSQSPNADEIFFQKIPVLT